jgi:hypothetical protein
MVPVAFKDAPMRFSQQFRMTMTRRGEKEARLGAFMAKGLQGLAGPTKGDDLQPGGPAERAILIIARSAQSPVVKSVAALVREIAESGCAVRLILAKGERAGLSDAVIAAQTAGLDCELRVVRNPRLIEAHEQLVLGARACWTGDTMRRDPAICDAYESFVEDAPELAAAARLTFERLWAASEPLTALPPVAAAQRTPKAIGLRTVVLGRS